MKCVMFFIILTKILIYDFFIIFIRTYLCTLFLSASCVVKMKTTPYMEDSECAL